MVGRIGPHIRVRISLGSLEAYHLSTRKADKRLVSRIAMVPGSKQVLIEAPHILLPWSRTRVIVAPLDWLSLSTPMYTGRGSILLLLGVLMGDREIWSIGDAWPVPICRVEYEGEESWVWN